MQADDVNLAAVPDSTVAFDVAGFGVVKATTTSLCGDLIGKVVVLADSTWGTAYSGSDRSTCVIDGFVWELALPGRRVEAVVVRTVADGYRYVFPYQDIKRAM